MNPKFEHYFLRVWLCFPKSHWQIREEQHPSLVLDQYCNENANTFVCFHSSHRSSSHAIFFFLHFISTSPQIQSLLTQSLQHGKSRQKESVLSCLLVLSYPVSSNFPFEIFYVSYAVTLSTSFYYICSVNPDPWAASTILV